MGEVDSYESWIMIFLQYSIYNFIKQKNRQTMDNLATIIVDKYIKQDFMPQTNKAIYLAITKKKVSQIMPQAVTAKVIQTILEPTVKNCDKPATNLTLKTPYEEIHCPQKEPQIIKVPKRKFKSVQIQPNLEEQTGIFELVEKHSTVSNENRSTKSTGLIKLPEQEVEQQDEEVKEIKRLKLLQKKFEKMKQENRLRNQRLKKRSKYDKQNSLNGCLYHHTYDYQANIVNVPPKDQKDFSEPQYHKSLLEVIKNNLDSQVQKYKQAQKLKEIKEAKERLETSQIPQGFISRVQETTGKPTKKGNKSSQVKQSEKAEPIDKSIKPYFSFENSEIRSLNENLQSILEEGVKMVTHEHELYQQKELHSNNRVYKIREKDVVNEKPKKKHTKEKTHSSQSIIYGVQNELRNPSLIDIMSNPIRQSSLQQPSKYQSLQFNQQSSSQKYEALTQMLKRHSRHVSIDIDSRVNYPQLPSIAKINRQSRVKKRTATEHKMINGLEGVQVQVKTPQPKNSIHFSQRAGRMSALAIKKQTQSSLEQHQDQKSSRRSEAKSKKEFVRDYYRNYRQQFRHRMKGIEQAINAYS